ncbi:hypothetical protein VTN00DRAFT_9562 [Thermoascus crustaceus]|uniref:uncharacterized protein n=1 Tax=Thermoascus crustaceus TaxID=5088 RepID=UPI003742BC99
MPPLRTNTRTPSRPRQNSDAMTRCSSAETFTTAKNRASFTKYHQISGTAGGAPVAGVGTVELTVKWSPADSDPYVLVLKPVLHLPGAPCNGFNWRVFDGRIAWSGCSVPFRLLSGAQPLWHGTPFVGLSRLVPAEHPQGYSALEEHARGGGNFSLSVYLTLEEQSNLFNEMIRVECV